MGVEPPFIYDKPSSYTFDGPTNRGFNPKAVTHASWTPKQAKPRQDGPLINFNRHPDSYYQSPYGNTSFIPMHPKTKKRVAGTWKVQRVLRVLALVGALGAVFCIITIRKTTPGVSWLIRVGPAGAVVHTLYATYFLSRRINSRPPASCASYHWFAALLDVGLTPFFALSCYMATRDYSDNTYGWDTIFNNNDIDYKIIQGFMIVTGVVGGFLLCSLLLDIWLAVTYRKISHLPPDQNPLEEKDNLTARPNHKRNKSDLLFEKHLSSSTLASQRMSQASTLNLDGNRKPFKHTRTDSYDGESFSFKKDFVGEIKDPYNTRASMQQDRRVDSLGVLRPSSATLPASNARPAGAGLEHKPARSSGLVKPPRTGSWFGSSNYECMVAEDQGEYNRVVSPGPIMFYHNNNPAQSLSTEKYPCQPPAAPAHNQENDMPSPEQLSLALPPFSLPEKKRSREPLGMNPPTPVNQSFDESLTVRPLSVSTPSRHALTETDANSVGPTQYGTPASRPASFVGSGTKSRFYGNLRSSIGGSPTRGSHDREDEDEGFIGRSNTTKSAESANFEVYASSDSEEDYDPYRNPPPTYVQPGPAVTVTHTSPGRTWNGQRQISNSTGFDLQSGYAGLDPEFGKGMARRREVSGKMAEEGRVEVLALPMSGQIEEVKPGAAGWARFKGL